MYPTLRIHGLLQPIEGSRRLTVEDIERILASILSHRKGVQLSKTDELDAAITLPDGSRARINVSRQQGTLAAAIRLLPNRFFEFEQLGLSTMVLESICRLHAGLILVTGATSSGKSTTIASMVNRINQTRPCRILTIEDPVEYRHISDKAFVTQREIGADSASFPEALRRSLRQDPDVIVIGEMRDTETMSAALTLAETGHLTFATLHTSSAIQTISRVISAYPAAQQPQIRIQLATTLQYIICQQLIPWDNGGGRSLAAEVLAVSPAVRAMIRDEKTHQIATTMQTNAHLGSKTMNQSLEELVNGRRITEATAYEYSNDKSNFQLHESNGRAPQREVRR
jgi:twitching motility protein PilT